MKRKMYKRHIFPSFHFQKSRVMEFFSCGGVHLIECRVAPQLKLFPKNRDVIKY